MAVDYLLLFQPLNWLTAKRLSIGESTIQLCATNVFYFSRLHPGCPILGTLHRTLKRQANITTIPPLFRRHPLSGRGRRASSVPGLGKPKRCKQECSSAALRTIFAAEGQAVAKFFEQRVRIRNNPETFDMEAGHKSPSHSLAKQGMLAQPSGRPCGGWFQKATFQTPASKARAQQ